ncbi:MULTISPECIES: hypothetical protein [Shewanella]|nr:hypothetical protein [Shewanella psychromarinicola]
MSFTINGAIQVLRDGQVSLYHISLSIDPNEFLSMLSQELI